MAAGDDVELIGMCRHNSAQGLSRNLLIFSSADVAR